MNSSHSSKTTKNRSNLDIIGALMSRLYFSDFDLSYLPKSGFAAARIDALAFKVACIDALAMEIVCYSIAS
jgi:hypothetical protein